MRAGVLRIPTQVVEPGSEFTIWGLLFTFEGSGCKIVRPWFQASGKGWRAGLRGEGSGVGFESDLRNAPWCEASGATKAV